VTLPAGHDVRSANLRFLEAAQSVASIVAPLTIIAAILGYSGWVRTRAYYGYFGISSSMLALTPQDYLFQSAGVGFGAVLLVVLAVVVFSIVDRLIQHIICRMRTSRQERTRWFIATFGALLTLSALGLATNSVMRAATPPVTGAAMLALGAVLYLRFGLSLPWHGTRMQLPTIAMCTALLMLASFWALTAYAKDLGDGAARDVDRNITALTAVTVYSKEPIDLAGGNIKGSRVRDQDEKWNYRYAGARLLIYSNDRWFIIPKSSSERYRSSVTVLLDNEKVRVETVVPK
jgi:hypothetical protein